MLSSYLQYLSFKVSARRRAADRTASFRVRASATPKASVNSFSVPLKCHIRCEETQQKHLQLYTLHIYLHVVHKQLIHLQVYLLIFFIKLAGMRGMNTQNDIRCFVLATVMSFTR